MMAFCQEHPKWDQNPKFTPLNETTSIPTPFICGVPPSPPPGTRKLFVPTRNSIYEHLSVMWSARCCSFAPFPRKIAPKSRSVQDVSLRKKPTIRECRPFPLDCEQCLFFFRFSKRLHARTSVERRSRETRLSRLAPSVTRVVICLSYWLSLHEAVK